MAVSLPRHIVEAVRAAETAHAPFSRGTIWIDFFDFDNIAKLATDNAYRGWESVATSTQHRYALCRCCGDHYDRSSPRISAYHAPDQACD